MTRSTKLSAVIIASGMLALSFLGCHREPAPQTAASTTQAPPPAEQPPPPPTEANTTPTHLPVETEWVDIPLDINYPTGGSRLDDRSRALLREAYASVGHRTDIVRISVDGHADSRGNQADNERLALERAQGVVDFLVGELGMPRELFEIHGHGSEQPRSSGTTAGDRLLNRRVEFRILVRRQAAL